MVLEVAAGVGLTFLLVSLICSALREGLEVATRTRARDLERGLRELLDDPDGSGLAKAFFDHPLIFALFQGAYQPEQLQTRHGGALMPLPVRRRLPSYIPANHFAAAVLDLIGRGPAAHEPYQFPQPEAQQLVTLEALRARLADFPHERLRRVVLAALDASGGDLPATRARLEGWYDAAMERVAGRYRRRTQVILFGLGLLVAAGLNVDPLAIGQRLYRDDLLRQAVAAQAATLRPGDLKDAPVARLSADLAAFGLPVGWTPPPQPVACAAGRSCIAGLNALALAGMVLGWLITAIAATLGAPFWFDLLNRFAAIRSTTKPAEADPGRAPPFRPGPSPALPPAPVDHDRFEPHAWADAEAGAGVL